MLSDIAILAVGARSTDRKSRESASIAVVAVSQLLAAEASVDCQAGEQFGAEQTSATPTAAAVTPPGSRQATA